MSSVLLYASPADALPQSYKRLVGAMTTKLVFYDKHPAYCQDWSNRVSGKCEAKREKEPVLDGTILSQDHKSLNLRVSVGSLSKGVFKRRTSTGSEAFPL